MKQNQGLSVNPVFHNLMITRPSVLLQQPIVIQDTNRLYLNNVSIKWDTRNIINVTYSSEYHVLFVLCDDWKLYVYNEQLMQIACFNNWESKYTVGFQLIEPRNLILLIGVSEVEALHIKINTNIKQTKFLSSMKLSLEKQALYTVDNSSKLKWNKGYGYELQDDLLYMWGLQDINFYDLRKLTLKSKITKLVKKEFSISYVYFNRSYRYTITGLINGNVRVWRVPTSQVASKECILIHNCVHHMKNVEKIVGGSDDRVIMSCSIDLSLCVWSLETFQLFRVYDFSSEYSKIYLVNEKIAYAVKDAEFGVLNFGKTMEFITEITSSILSYDKCMTQDRRIHSIQLTMADNLGIQIQASQLARKDLNKTNIQYIYPPLKAKAIRMVISSPYYDNQYYLLVESGQIFKLRIQDNSGRIEHCYCIDRTIDIQKHCLNQDATCIKFLKFVPSQFDSEIVDGSFIKTKQKPITDKQGMLEECNRLKLITVGCSKGSVVFLNTENMDNIYARITFHRDHIVNIESVYCQVTNTAICISMCCEQYIKFVRFENDKAYCFKSIFGGASIVFMKGIVDRLALVFKSGLFDLLIFDQKDNPYAIQNLQAANHEGQIYSLDQQMNKRLILTAGSDNCIKIWTYLKVKLYQITLDEGLRYAIWSNDLQIILEHNLKILYLRQMPFSPTSQEIQQHNQSLMDSIFCNKIYLKSLMDYMGETISQNNIHVDLSTIKPHKSKQFSIGNKSFAHKQVTQQKVVRKFKSKTKRQQIKSYTQQVIDRNRPSLLSENDIDATKKHIQEMRNLRQLTAHNILPCIETKKDSFDQFMKSKLVNKKVLTRRDITLNRIIMRNMIKQQIGEQSQILNTLKLEF